MKEKNAYNEVFKVLNKYKDILIFDINDLQTKSKLHLLGLELKEVYGLDIDPRAIRSFDWIDFGEHRKIAWYGGKYNRTISWSVDGRQPEDELLMTLKFPTGAYIFGDGGIFNKDYPTQFFQKFWIELKSYNPDYIDEANHCLYWKIENAKTIFNSFNDVLNKYYKLNSEDIKQRRIEKMKKELEQLEKES